MGLEYELHSDRQLPISVYDPPSIGIGAGIQMGRFPLTT